MEGESSNHCHYFGVRVSRAIHDLEFVFAKESHEVVIALRIGSNDSKESQTQYFIHTE